MILVIPSVTPLIYNNKSQTCERNGVSDKKMLFRISREEENRFYYHLRNKTHVPSKFSRAN